MNADLKSPAFRNTRWFPRTAVVTALLVVAIMAGCKHESAPAPDVWAVVNGQPIHQAEVQKYYSSRVNAQSQPGSQDEALSLTLNVLDELINNEILIEGSPLTRPSI